MLPKSPETVKNNKQKGVTKRSDKEITEQSGLIQHLLPGKTYYHHRAFYNTVIYLGNVILADRGFTCDDYARMTLAEVKIPPFTKGKKQLEKVEVDWGQELPVVRIHVERVIGVLKQKYLILQGTLLVVDENDSTIDQIVSVCCACVNLRPSVVSQD